MRFSGFIFSIVAILAFVAGSMFFVSSRAERTTPIQVNTFYGTVDIDEPVLIELLQSKGVQRLKDIHQYGVMRYAVPTEAYTRYEHSLGVFALLRRAGVSLEEQIAGLLHDTSHTVFSHVGDFVFHHHDADRSYQDDIHSWYLRHSGLADILEKYGYTVEDIHPKSGHFKALEQDLPNLCIDRIEYNIQGAVLRELLASSDVDTILNDLRFENGKWYSTTAESARKLGDVSLHFTEHVWGAEWNLLVYDWTGQALRRAMEIGLITYDDIHFSCDQEIWARLRNSDDAEIRTLVGKILNIDKHFTLCAAGEEADVVLKGKFRGIDPMVLTPEGLQPLTKIDLAYADEYARVQKVMKNGWAIKLK